MHHDFNSRWRFGSADFADEQSIHDAGLFGPSGLQLGFRNGRVLRYPFDAPLLSAAPSGAGKGNGVIAYVVCRSPGEPMLILDPKGELASFSMVAHAHHREHVYCWNPYGVAGLPRHKCNPLSVLDPKSEFFFADCAVVAEALVVSGGKSEDHYWAQRARGWIKDFLVSLALRHGQVSFPSLYRLINAILANPQVWADHAEFMLTVPDESVQRTASEILEKQPNSPREFGSVFGTVLAAIAFCDDPVLLASLDNPDFSLDVLCANAPISKVFIVIPAQYLSALAPANRAFFAAVMALKSRTPQAKRITFLVDEAAQMKKFDALENYQTYGRGIGIRTWSFWQDIGQIINHYGEAALRSFVGSSGVLQMFGLRDYTSAEELSQRLGYETLHYDDARMQMEARHRQYTAIDRMQRGEDYLTAVLEAHHQGQVAQVQNMQARRLMTADEILTQSAATQWIMMGNLKPILAEKFPYYTRPEMIGYYLANPYHPPIDSVTIPSRRGPQRVRIITERVPTAFAHFPQYQSGYWSYVEGYRPS